MATRKVTVTVPDEILGAARGLTENLSGYVAEALARQVRHDLLGQELRRYQTEHGPFGFDELAAAEAELFGAAGASQGAA
ncbi:MAG: type II toxin-antitoxin system CcdA family antitoxin [Bifidobacteriaceae bacterium]|jgi:post-segregation antitoxin (ccd killing protein)|nr:type II toxin-antitoxin system CcdA family antitoxin [Bifidobacteriaceae bacterium]